MGLRLLFAGVPRFALALMDAGHDLRAIALPFVDDEDDSWGLLTRASTGGIPLVPATAVTADANDDERAVLQSRGPYDLVLVASFDRKVSSWARALGRRGAWNVHPSLLPRHRGYNPYFWSILGGDAVSGVTVHEMTDAFDDGAILAQREVPVPAGSTSGQLFERLQDATMPLVLPVLAATAEGRPPAPVPQNRACATHDPRPTDEHLTVDVHQPAANVVRHIRAATPEPGALVPMDGEVFLVRGAAEGPAAPPGMAPGTVFVADGLVHVAARPGSFRPYTVERRGGVVTLAPRPGRRP